MLDLTFQSHLLHRPNGQNTVVPLRTSILFHKLIIEIMEDYEELPSSSGILYYYPDQTDEDDNDDSSLITYFCSRIARPQPFWVARYPSSESVRSQAVFRKSLRRCFNFGKLAGTKENAKRFLRLVTSSTGPDHQSNPVQQRNSRRNRANTVPGNLHSADEMLAVDAQRSRNVNPSIDSPTWSHRPRLVEDLRTISGSSSQAPPVAVGPIENEKPIASGNGVSISIALAEPMLFLQGFDQQDAEQRNTTMLRGSLHLRVSKAAKIKSIYLKFRGRAETEWPEGW